MKPKSSFLETSQPTTANVETTHGNSQPPPAASVPRKETLFHLVAKSARNVLLAADFTGWDRAPIKMVKAVSGIWKIKVPLPPGRYRYRFLIDHEASGNPDVVGTLTLPFGTLSGVVEVRG